ncbi:hypothetical protein CEXT_63031 [Caerostris extrusa]|uniref:Uncharacterized protein n=1 Tax=Caerostris extrusa TaxID=172846 RepID=A0AAV4VNQ6_CAEEX|nr:hypothetical protein CEXT_63031 [Caerostris extrusa]
MSSDENVMGCLHELVMCEGRILKVRKQFQIPVKQIENPTKELFHLFVLQKQHFVDPPPAADQPPYEVSMFERSSRGTAQIRESGTAIDRSLASRGLSADVGPRRHVIFRLIYAGMEGD